MDAGGLKWDQDQDLPPRGVGGNNFSSNFMTNIMQCPTFTNVYWDLNIKNRAANGGPLNLGAPCHGITGILVNPALGTP